MTRKDKPEGVLVSFDIGNGYVKVRGPGGAYSSYPSVMAVMSDSLDGFDFSLNGSTKRVIGLHGRRYAIGESVYYDGQTPVTVAHRSRINMDYYRVLFASALTEVVHQSQTVRAVVSLPPAAYWDKDRQKATLSGAYDVQRMAFRTGPTQYHYEVPAQLMRVIPEGLGTICAMALDENGYERADFYLAQASVGIVDVGTYTTDLIQLDRLRIVRNGCATITHALHDIHERIQAYASSVNVDIERYKLDEVLHRGYFLSSGRRVEIGHEVGAWARELATAISALIRTTWNGGDNVEYIIVTGGGAPLVQTLLAMEFPHVRLMDAVEPFFANCEGGYRYGLLRERAGE